MAWLLQCHSSKYVSWSICAKWPVGNHKNTITHESYSNFLVYQIILSSLTQYIVQIIICGWFFALSQKCFIAKHYIWKTWNLDFRFLGVSRSMQCEWMAWMLQMLILSIHYCAQYAGNTDLNISFYCIVQNTGYSQPSLKHGWVITTCCFSLI